MLSSSKIVSAEVMARGALVKGLMGLESSSLRIEERVLFMCCLKGEVFSVMISQR